MNPSHPANSQLEGVAPADAPVDRPWPLPMKILAYLTLALAGFVAVWFINRPVDSLAR
jgi:hypothetical protein